MLGRLDPSLKACRVIGVRGGGVDGVGDGAVVPLGPGEADGVGAGNGVPAPDVEIDRAFLDSLGVQARVCVPLELTNGSIVGVLAALDRRAGSYSYEDVALLGIAGRLLSHEWESVERRAELRRIRGQLADSPTVDADTGLLNRQGFLELLDHDWGLAERGTVESTLVAFRVEGAAGAGGAIDRIAVRIAAEVLEGCIRKTDRAARVGEQPLVATLVGCPADQAPAFVSRFRAALDRVTRSGNPAVDLAYGVRELATTSSAEEALGLAEAAVEASTARPMTPQPIGAEAPR
jgi:GGDEF domain-containing protein